MSTLVFVENGRTVTDSLTVAEVFGKNHRDVLRDIRNLDCSEQFRVRNFAQTPYVHEQNGQSYLKYFITQDGFSFLVMGYTGKEAARFKEMYINEFNRMRNQLAIDATDLSPELQMFKHIFEGVARVQLEQAETQKQLQSVQSTVTTITETLLVRDKDWRKSINTMLNGAAIRSGERHRDLRNRSYQILESRGRCDLNIRLKNLHERLYESGATKTKINSTTKLDVIEADPRLKEIYTTIVKELSIGTLGAVR